MLLRPMRQSCCRAMNDIGYINVFALRDCCCLTFFAQCDFKKVKRNTFVINRYFLNTNKTTI